MGYDGFNEQKYWELMNSELPTANIIVAGITGTGKSTLINAVFGSSMAATGTGEPVTDEMKAYSNSNVPVVIWDTVGLELNSAKTKESIEKIHKTIAEKASLKNQFDRIHAIWYCINSGSNRYQGAELEFIKKLHSEQVPFIIVMTQCIGSEEDCNEFEAEIRRINRENGMNDIEIVQVLAKDFSTRGVNISKFGLKELVEITTEKMPEFIKAGFIAAQRVEVVQKRIQSEEIIMKYVEMAQSGFWEKVPLINLITTQSETTKMFEKIGKMYSPEWTEEHIRQVMGKDNLGNSLKKCGKAIMKSVTSKLNELTGGKGKKGKVLQYLQDVSRQDGFEVEISKLSNSTYAARMIAFYGYAYVLALEEVWNRSTEKQMEDVEYIVDEMKVEIIKKLEGIV